MHALTQASGGPGKDLVATEALRRMTAGACGSFLLVAPAFLVLWYLAGDPVTSAVLAATMLLAAFTRMALRGGAPPGRLAALMALAVTATVACGTWRSGGAGTTHATWFLVLPLFGTYLFGAVGCLAVSTLCLASMAGMWTWQYAWGVPPSRIDPSYVGLFELAHVLGIALAIALVTVHWRRTALFERRQREELKAGFAHAVESMHDAVLVLDREGAVETANRSGGALLASLSGGPRTLLDWLERATGRPAAALLKDIDLSSIRHAARRQHAHRYRAGAAPRQRGGAAREPREERVPGQSEPRDPHADERHPRHDRARAAVRPRCDDDRPLAHRATLRPLDARAAQRRA